MIHFHHFIESAVRLHRFTSLRMGGIRLQIDHVLRLVGARRKDVFWINHFRRVIQFTDVPVGWCVGAVNGSITQPEIPGLIGFRCSLFQEFNG